jgi:Big-like domain-containing protein
MKALWLALALAAAVATPAAAQMNQYEMQFGEPVDVALSDLLHNPESYLDRAVRTHGQLEMGMDMRQSYRLRDTFGDYLIVQPINDISIMFEQEARKGFGKEFEITGVFRQRNLANSTDQSSDRTTPYAILFWAYIGPPDKEADKAAEKAAQSVRLEDLVTHPGKYEGKVVRVVGLFRGENLYGDLPSRSQRRGADWVIKDDLFAVWVSGRKPKGDGFSLDASLKRDTGKWIEVVGRVASVGPVVYIQASTVSLGSPPKDSAVTAQASPTPPPPERPKVPPVVVFALPLDGDREVPRAIRFQVQFNKDMNEDSFKDRVVLRYAGRPQPGDREFTAVRVTYDGGHRALVVDPGDVLRPGRVVELLLLPGIVDTDGMMLEPRAAHPVGSVVDVFRYQVATF